MDAEHIEHCIGVEMVMKICKECSQEFELQPKKAGNVNLCPACSPAPPLLPKEAREAAKCRNNEIYDAHFREAIVEKRKAKALGQSATAAKLEKDIVTLGKMRIRP